jgi:hypothetical protein
MICIYMLREKVKGPNSNAGFSPPKFLELLPELQ